MVTEMRLKSTFPVTIQSPFSRLKGEISSCDGKCVDDHVKLIYESNFLKYVSLACDGDMFFVRCECKAEMKRSMSYKDDVCVDGDGCFLQCQCRYAARIVPSAVCKHVCTVLFQLQMFSESVEIVTEETCIQTLQTFQQANQYKGSPLKSKDLPLANQNLSFIFEPREPGYLDGELSENRFRSVWYM